MGKGQRNRTKRDSERPEYESVRASANRLQKTAKVLSITAVVLTTLTTAFQALLQWIMYSNLHGGVYEEKGNAAEDIAALAAVLPSGAVSLVLILLGTILATVFLCKKRPALSLIGCAGCAAGVAFFIYFVQHIAQLFTYNELVGVNNGVGLSFNVLMYQHYSALLPLFLFIPSEILAFRAAKKRIVADVMEHADDTSSTLSIAEDDNMDSE